LLEYFSFYVWVCRRGMCVRRAVCVCVSVLCSNIIILAIVGA